MDTFRHEVSIKTQTVVVDDESFVDAIDAALDNLNAAYNWLRSINSQVDTDPRAAEIARAIAALAGRE